MFEVARRLYGRASFRIIGHASDLSDLALSRWPNFPRSVLISPDFLTPEELNTRSTRSWSSCSQLSFPEPFRDQPTIWQKNQ